MSQVVSATVAQRRFQLMLLALFAVTALLTACIGIYGVIASSLMRRRGEIGIRMALGAPRTAIHRLVMGEGLRAAVLGLGAGIPVSLALGRVFGSLLFEMRPNDPVTIAGVAVLLSLVVAVACYVPARRATAGELNSALRLDRGLPEPTSCPDAAASFSTCFAACSGRRPPRLTGQIRRAQRSQHFRC